MIKTFEQHKQKPEITYYPNGQKNMNFIIMINYIETMDQHQ